MAITSTARSSPRRSCACARSKTILTEKGYVDPAALDAIVEAYETKIGPHNGARRRRQGLDRSRLQAGAARRTRTAAIATLGHVSRVGDHLVAVENTPQRHNMIVCTLCSCYPWEVLGLPPVWYKSAPYRSRAVKRPARRARRFRRRRCRRTPKSASGISTAETRFIVLPMRPAGTEGWSEEQARRPRHARLDDRHRPARTPDEIASMNGVHDMGGMDGFGKVEAEPNEPPFHARWEGRVLAMQRAMGYAGAWHIDDSRFAQETLPPHGLSRGVLLPALGAGDGEATCSSAAIASPEEIAAGHALRPRQAAAAQAHAPTWSQAGMTRSSFFRQQQGPARVQAGRPRAHREHPSADATPACRATPAARSARSS